jgi:hypothetical protein
MKHPLKSHGSRLSSLSTAPRVKWTAFCGETGLARKVTQLLLGQTKLLETANLLSRADLDAYETRSERISELIRLLAEE